ncbi:MAG: class II fructose-bisphosphatase [Candidatus Pelagibacter sp.]
MDIDKIFQDQLIRITQQAAVSVYPYLGKNDKIIADEAATNSMRKNLNKMNIKGNIVIGEGEMDEAPMLYIGEKVGTESGPELDIAVDPLEGTNFAAKNLPGAISVIAISNKNDLFNAPESYMEKISYPKDIDHSAIDLDFSLKKNLSNLADAKNKKFESLRICVLDRPRHKKIIDEAKSLNIDVKLISDGDVSGALLVTDEKHNIDLFLGTGGGPEGVLSASALDSYGCGFQGRFIFDTDELKKRANKMGISDFDKKYMLKEIIKGDSIFCATGITNGDLVDGLELKVNKIITRTLITHKSQNTTKIVTGESYIKE